MISFIKATIAATAGLLLAVMLVQWVVQLTTGEVVTPNGFLGEQAILWGFIADGIRGVLLAYLYPQMKNAGSSYLHAIKFGIVASLLVATLWVVFQWGTSTALSTSWLVQESIIILLQGILSGMGLGWAYKSKKDK